MNASTATDDEFTSSVVLMVGARRKQSTSKIANMSSKKEKETDVPRENVFLFVPNLIGTCIIKRSSY